MLIYQWRPHRITQEINYKDGLKAGKMYVFDRHGKVVEERTFKEGIEQKETAGGGSFRP